MALSAIVMFDRSCLVWFDTPLIRLSYR